jgi:putative membrane protein
VVSSPPAPADPLGERAALDAPSPAVENAASSRAFSGPTTGVPVGESAAKTERPLNDGEIIGVAIAANKGEIQMAEVAAKRATRADVKQFAAMMKTHHTQGLQKAKSVETKTKLTAADSEVTQQLDAETQAAMKDLRDKDGIAFDRAYMDSQVKAHADLLGTIDRRLVPGASHGDVKTLLTEMRRVVSDHLTAAEDIQKKLSATAMADGDAGAPSPVGKDPPAKAKAKQKPTAGK